MFFLAHVELFLLQNQNVTKNKLIAFLNLSNWFILSNLDELASWYYFTHCFDILSCVSRCMRTFNISKRRMTGMAIGL